MCNLYDLNDTRDALVKLFPRGLRDQTNDGPPPGQVYPDYHSIVIRLDDGEATTVRARWGLPTPETFLAGKRVDRGVTNVRNTGSAHWRRWLGPENRCLVPFNQFSEPGPDGPVYFRLRSGAPGFFAGIWVPDWTSTRKLREGPTTNNLFAFLTCEPNAEVAMVHPKAMPVILVDPADWETWLNAPWQVARHLQRPLPDGSLEVV